MSDTTLKSKFLMLQEALRKLSIIHKKSKKEFLEDFLISDTAIRNLQVSIESISDIGNYLLKRNSDTIPQTRVEIFQLLCRHGYLPNEMEDVLIEMARFRNLIVHRYDSIKLEMVYSILQEQLSFLKEVAVIMSDKIGGI
ncbi:MAG: DUF86 domain-containing protein [Candidatus Lokiarchaeota archaeon]|nr:DUF86 domain-containing protein [Candidatus Lokiarchaeota archaeon]